VEPTFLTLAEVLEIHQDRIQRYSGEPGVRDMGLLKSATGTPSAAFGEQFLHTDLFEMGAAYLFHLTRNHPFVDGNKRIGFVAALVFFALNGISVDANEACVEERVLSVAGGDMAKSEIAAFFREHAATE
jgi:death-on-curing protein